MPAQRPQSAGFRYLCICRLRCLAGFEGGEARAADVSAVSAASPHDLYNYIIRPQQYERADPSK